MWCWNAVFGSIFCLLSQFTPLHESWVTRAYLLVGFNATMPSVSQIPWEQWYYHWETLVCPSYTPTAICHIEFVLCQHIVRCWVKRIVCTGDMVNYVPLPQHSLCSETLPPFSIYISREQAFPLNLLRRPHFGGWEPHSGCSCQRQIFPAAYPKIRPKYHALFLGHPTFLTPLKRFNSQRASYHAINPLFPFAIQNTIAWPPQQVRVWESSSKPASRTSSTGGVQGSTLSGTFSASSRTHSAVTMIAAMNFPSAVRISRFARMPCMTRQPCLSWLGPRCLLCTLSEISKPAQLLSREALRGEWSRSSPSSSEGFVLTTAVVCAPRSACSDSVGLPWWGPILRSSHRRSEQARTGEAGLISSTIHCDGHALTCSVYGLITDWLARSLCF